MNILKYGSAFSCGYGCFRYDTYGPSRFITEVNIVATSKSTSESRRLLAWNPAYLDHLIIDGKKIPVYLIYDGDEGKWREYFSGMRIAVKSRNDALKNDCSYQYDVDRNLAYSKYLTVIDIRECSATEFAEGVSQLSDSKIKAIVQKLRDLDANAQKWTQKFEALVKEVKDERTQKEAAIPSIESKLALGFGKYGMAACVSDSRTVKAEEKATNGDGPYKEAMNREVASGSSKRTPHKTDINEKDKARWIVQDRCAYCGGEFKGFFSKVCRNCGKAKSY